MLSKDEQEEEEKQVNVAASAAPRNYATFNKSGSLTWQSGYYFTDKYQLTKKLGNGSYGEVIEAMDTQSGQHVALKISKRQNFEQNEAKCLLLLNKLNDPSKHFIVCLHSHFHHHGHLCMSLERLGPSLFDYIQETNFKPVAMPWLKPIAKQLCSAVDFLHRNKCIHADLKPENIVFAKRSRVREDGTADLDIRLIDFGEAVFEGDVHLPRIQTHSFRAPEVLLQLGWSYPSDVWSIGCTLFELYTGRELVPAGSYQLGAMHCVLGAIPKKMATNSITGWQYSKWAIGYKKADYEHLQPLDAFRLSNNDDDARFFDLIKQMLIYEPEERSRMGDLLAHRFFVSN